MDVLCVVGTYALSIIGGWLVAGTVVFVMRRGTDSRKALLQLEDLWVGGTERCVVTTLVILKSPLVPTFIAWWVTLKFAANWKRKDGPDIGTHGLAFLVGSAFSFAVAIAAGLLISPDALQILVSGK